jgi:hypothetical protein
MDTWKSIAKGKYFAVTFHDGIDTDWSMRSFLLDIMGVVKRETAEQLTLLAEEVIAKWGLDKINSWQ